MVDTHLRAREVNDRVMPVHWEGEFTEGARHKSSVGVPRTATPASTRA